MGEKVQHLYCLTEMILGGLRRLWLWWL